MFIRIFRYLVVLVSLIIGHGFSPCFADGCFFYEQEQIGNSAESPNQRALIVFNGERQTMVLQVKYSGNVDQFAWVVPLPALPENNTITTASDSIFEELHKFTQPVIYFLEGKDHYSGGGRITSPNQNPEESVLAVKVWNNLQVGPYNIALLSGSSSSHLSDWLNQNDFQFPSEANDIIDFYIAKGWYFAAVKTHILAEEPDKNSTYQSGLPAIRMTFKTTTPVFPLRISELSSAGENEIELYIASDHRMVSSSYNTVKMDHDAIQKQVEQHYESSTAKAKGISCACSQMIEPDDPKTPFDYEKVFLNAVNSTAEPVFVVEYATEVYNSSNNYSGMEWINHCKDSLPTDSFFWLTRLRTVLTPDDMKQDVDFIADPEGDDYLRLHFFVEPKNEYENPWIPAVVLTLPAIFLLPVPIFGKIRKKHGRRITLFILLTILALA